MAAQLERMIDANSSVNTGVNARVNVNAAQPLTCYEPLYAANYAFLELLCVEARTIKSGSLPLSLSRTLARLSPAMLQRIASCPFALFDVRDMVVHPGHDGIAERSPSISAARYQVASASLFYVWHQLHVAPVRARLWFGLDARTAHTLRAASAHSVAEFANQHADALLPRSAHHVLFWPELLRHAESGDTCRLQALVWLGRQLLTEPSSCG
jgi:hypothetical protein